MWRKKLFFWSQFARFGAYFSPKAPTQTQTLISTKNRERAHPLNGALLVMLIYLSFPFLFPSFLSSFSFLFFFSLFSFPFLFFFWRPFSDPGGRGPQSPPGYARDWRLPSACQCSKIMVESVTWNRTEYQEVQRDRLWSPSTHISHLKIRNRGTGTGRYSLIMLMWTTLKWI